MLNALRPLAAFFKPRPQVLIGRGLYAKSVDQARKVEFYTYYGVRDEIGARFELLCLHVILLVTAMRGKGEAAEETAQAAFDAFMQGLDDTLREQGVGDVSVPKKMKKIITTVYTRMKTWDDLWTADAEPDAQIACLKETVFAVDDEDAPIAALDIRAAALFDYVNAARTTLSPDALLIGTVDWPALKTLDLAATEGQ